MRTATNHAGYEVQTMTPYGWRQVGFGAPHSTRELAQADMAELTAAAPDREFRVYPAMEVA